LRARHREGRRQRILLAASELFRTLGYDETSIDSIAAHAEVSVPTIYTYFPSKQELLLGLLEEDRRQIRTILEPVLEALPEDPVDALVAIAQACVEQGVVEISCKPVWREISAAALKATAERRKSVLQFQDIHVEALRGYLEALRGEEIIRADLDLESASRALYAISRNCFRLYLMTERAGLADLRAMLRQDLSTVFPGFLSQGVAVRRRAKRRPKK
jgi:AcrR family transcriptional regulator